MYRISLCAVDVQTNEEANPTFAEFTFFGAQGDIIIGKDAEYVVAETRGQAGYVPCEISDLVGRKFLDGDYNYFQVQTTEHLHGTASSTATE